MTQRRRRAVTLRTMFIGDDIDIGLCCVVHFERRVTLRVHRGENVAHGKGRTHL